MVIDGFEDVKSLMLETGENFFYISKRKINLETLLRTFSIFLI